MVDTFEDAASGMVQGHSCWLRVAMAAVSWPDELLEAYNKYIDVHAGSEEGTLQTVQQVVLEVVLRHAQAELDDAKAIALRLSKLSLVHHKYIVRVVAQSVWEYPAQANCNSCGAPWCAKYAEVLDRLRFEVPGGFSEFVCPVCRHILV